MGDNFFVMVTAAVTDMVTRHAGTFASTGMILFRSFALIVLVWFGLTQAFGAVSGRGFQWDALVGIVISFSFGYAMIFYYSTPIPGIGYSFTRLFTEQGVALAQQIEIQTSEQVLNKFSDVYKTMQHPTGASLFDFAQVARYLAIVFLLSTAQFAVFGVIAFGFVALGVIVLLGPIFVPFFIVPTMEWMFWGWLRALLQYAFYPVVANAFVFVFGTVIIHFLDANPGSFDAAHIARIFIQFVALGVAFVWGILKVPALVSSIFSGRAGDHAMPGLGWFRS